MPIFPLSLPPERTVPPVCPHRTCHHQHSIKLISLFPFPYHDRDPTHLSSVEGAPICEVAGTRNTEDRDEPGTATADRERTTQEPRVSLVPTSLTFSTGPVEGMDGNP